MHWSAEDISKISITAIQKKLPFAISYSDVTNYVGNLSLNPYAVPTTQRAKYITQFTFGDLMRQFHPEIITEKLTIPDEIKRITASESEIMSVVLNSYKFSGITNIKYNNSTNICATIIKINPDIKTDRLVSNIEFDFGLNEKQALHTAPQQIAHIPTAQSTKIKIKIEIKTGDTTAPTEKWIDIPQSSYGIIIDTRGYDIIEKCSTQQAKKLSLEWMKSLDIEVGDI